MVTFKHYVDTVEPTEYDDEERQVLIIELTMPMHFYSISANGVQIDVSRFERGVRHLTITDDGSE